MEIKDIRELDKIMCPKKKSEAEADFKKFYTDRFESVTSPKGDKMTKKVTAKKTVTKKVSMKKEDKLVKVKVSYIPSQSTQDDFCLADAGKQVEIKESLKKKIDSAFKKYQDAQNELAKLYFES